jgi:hypothetical protein
MTFLHCEIAVARAVARLSLIRFATAFPPLSSLLIKRWKNELRPSLPARTMMNTHESTQHYLARSSHAMPAPTPSIRNFLHG